MKGIKKKAFTLTELLVVVVVVGILSAVALPKFTRAIETRRTGEAEEMLTAIRTEQEKRCELDQKYAVAFDHLNHLVSSPQTNNYTYALASGGASAVSRGKSYSLSVPSYADGRLCCEGSYCEKLNKNYPACSALSGVKRESACELSACEINPNSCSCDSYAASHCECTGTCDPCAGKTCSGSSSQSCPSGYIGTQYRTCNCGVWSGWTGTCTPESKECSGPSSQSCGCNNGGTQTRTCDTKTGAWSGWSACSVGDCECSAGQSETGSACGNCGKQKRTCGSDGKWGAWIRVR